MDRHHLDMKAGTDGEGRISSYGPQQIKCGLFEFRIEYERIACKIKYLKAWEVFQPPDPGFL